jgi:rhamnose utilization protein RhaD (predicted bifunctional aldolase and dehydrogenase)
MTKLKNITELSHLFGSEDFVKGGGGNSSCKDEKTMWVKPSGTTLAGISEESFIALERGKITSLFSSKVPSLAADREKLVQRMMISAVKYGYKGRPSIEAPLHNMLNAVYVVHTHPALVNGMTCSGEGQKKCAELFPEALWVDYFNPGFSLCMGLKEVLEDYKIRHGKEPELIFLKNHGVFVSSDTTEGVSDTYYSMMATLRNFYQLSGIDQAMPEQSPVATDSEEMVKDLMGNFGGYSKTNSPFEICPGPLSPDHIVYSKSRPYEGRLSAEDIILFREKYGFSPRVFVAEEAIITIGATQNSADLAMLFARDAALVFRLTSVFGGASFMSREAAEFIENWEAESYRMRVAEK